MMILSKEKQYERTIKAVLEMMDWLENESYVVKSNKHADKLAGYKLRSAVIPNCVDKDRVTSEENRSLYRGFVEITTYLNLISEQLQYALHTTVEEEIANEHNAVKYDNNKKLAVDKKILFTLDANK